MKVASLLAALTLNSLVSADKYANFFWDDNCSVKGTIGFSLYNPGCFALDRPKSVYLPNASTGGGHFCLVITRESGKCNCQSAHVDFTAQGYCQKLPQDAHSFRFVSGTCNDPDVC